MTVWTLILVGWGAMAIVMLALWAVQRASMASASSVVCRRARPITALVSSAVP